MRAVTSGLYSNTNRFRSRHQMTLKYLIFKSMLAVQVFPSLLIDMSSWPPDQIALHVRAGATHRAMGARTSARGGAAPTRREPTSDAPEARDGRTPLRYDQGARGPLEI